MAHGVKGSRTPQCEIHTWFLHWQFIHNFKKKPKAKQSNSNICISQFFIYSQSLLKIHQADAMRVYATMKSWKLPSEHSSQWNQKAQHSKTLSVCSHPFWVN